MLDWQEKAKQLRENQERNQRDYVKQNSKAEERIAFLKQIEDEKAKVLSNTRRKRNFETQTNDSFHEKEFDR